MPYPPGYSIKAKDTTSPPLPLKYKAAMVTFSKGPDFVSVCMTIPKELERTNRGVPEDFVTLSTFQIPLGFRPEIDVHQLRPGKLCLCMETESQAIFRSNREVLGSLGISMRRCMPSGGSLGPKFGAWLLR